MEDESSASAPNETHPLLPLHVEASTISPGGDGNAETAVQDPSASSPSTANPTSDEDVTDECCTRSTPPCGDDSGVISSEPKAHGEGTEYKAIYDMLKDAEKAANDPDYEDKVYSNKFGAIKYNPRNQESSFGAVDYFCAIFHCCALCIEG